MPDVPAESIKAAERAIDAAMVDPDFRVERSAVGLARVAVEAAAPILAEAVAAKIEAHRAEWSQARPGQLVPTAWDRHMKIAARVAAWAFSTDDDKKRMAAAAITRGDAIICGDREQEGTDGGN